MRKVMVHLSPDMLIELKGLAAKQNQPYSQLIREALDRYLHHPNSAIRLRAFRDALELLAFSGLTTEEYKWLIEIGVQALKHDNAIPLPDDADRKQPSDLLMRLHRKEFVIVGDLVCLAPKGELALGLSGLPHPRVREYPDPLNVLFVGETH